jgi:hypothetical protein
MKYDRESVAKRNAEFASVVTLGTLEMAKMAGQIWRLQTMSYGGSIDSIHPAVNFILDYTGDFSGAYAANWLTSSTLIPKGSDRLKQNIGSVVAMTAAIAIEVLPIYGTPRLEDLPAAVAGIAAYRGLHYLLNKK